ncbi:UNKNOWN [Stylonychia lemnae]|uniref:Uncharacterized protein n=1 Tax=Stylonychia lemnae TaxID=5949 RepID=A0A078B292_STYLE|nr:UNKNOWN [Stylonychia lemnae]|eukprot:CDW87573.1 UNKNOWN [Stylonychia lemnae]
MNSICFDDYPDDQSDLNEYQTSNPIVRNRNFDQIVPQFIDLEDSYRDSEENQQYTEAFDNVKSIADDSPLKKENLELNDQYLMMDDLTPSRDQDLQIKSNDKTYQIDRLVRSQNFNALRFSDLESKYTSNDQLKLQDNSTLIRQNQGNYLAQSQTKLPSQDQQLHKVLETQNENSTTTIRQRFSQLLFRKSELSSKNQQPFQASDMLRLSTLPQAQQLKNDPVFQKLVQQFKNVPEHFLGQIYSLKNKDYHQTVDELFQIISTNSQIQMEIDNCIKSPRDLGKQQSQVKSLKSSLRRNDENRDPNIQIISKINYDRLDQTDKHNSQSIILANVNDKRVSFCDIVEGYKQTKIQKPSKSQISTDQLGTPEYPLDSVEFSNTKSNDDQYTKRDINLESNRSMIDSNQHDFKYEQKNKGNTLMDSMIMRKGKQIIEKIKNLPHERINCFRRYI